MDSYTKESPDETIFKLRIGACQELTEYELTGDIYAVCKLLLFMFDAAEVFIENLDTIFKESALKDYLCVDCLYAWSSLRVDLFVSVCTFCDCTDILHKVCNSMSVQILDIIELFLFGRQINLHRKVCTI